MSNKTTTEREAEQKAKQALAVNKVKPDIAPVKNKRSPKNSSESK